MNYIILSTYGVPSIKNIVELMENKPIILQKKNERWYKNGRKCTLPRFTQDDTIIKWGNYIPIEGNGATIINPSPAVKLASNKRESRKVLLDAGIPVPKTWFDIDNVPYGTKFIARPQQHSKGSEFYLIDSYSSIGTLYHEFVRNLYYYSAIFPKTNEYRVHVTHGKVLLINEKTLVDGDIRANQAVTGEPWSNAIRWDNYNKKMCKICCDAVKKIGLDCGAVDIMYNSNDDTYAICEVNTAPTTSDSEYLSTRYAKYFEWVFRSKREWYDYTQWNKGNSFAFKNEQLGE